MAFLFRLHLVGFDPQDEAQIQKRWKWILEAIKYSSPSLYQEISQKPYQSLKQDLKNKILKYLIRGRYRSTPFGLWAGVGIGEWSNGHFLESPIAYHPIPNTSEAKSIGATESNLTYQLAPGIIEYSDQVHYWSYCKQEEGWRISYLDKNPIILTLLSHFKKAKYLDRKGFESFFEVKSRGKITKIWNMILESGILILSDFPACSTKALGIDIRIQSKVFLPKSLQRKLDELISEFGSLFIPVESDFLSEFKKWFTFHYDDRFIPLSLISHVYDFTLGSHFSEPKVEKGEGFVGIWPLVKGTEEIDLSRFYTSKPTAVRHLQIVFKLFENDQIYIENIVCNREFAYSGRFSLDPELKEIISDQLPFCSTEVELVDLILFESSNANSICRHSNAFRFQVNPFGTGTGFEHLGIEDLFLGIREGKLILFSQRLGKPVIPVVQHPLNPNQITHSISRLLWEIGNQDQVRFLPYHAQAFQKSSYTPRLTWRGVILQGKRWLVDQKNFPSKSEFLNFLVEHNLPSPLVAGHLDRELVLDWTDPIQLDFLWKELNRTEELCLTECPWIYKSVFFNQSGESLYPQFVYGKACAPWEIKLPGFLNRISQPNFDWVYVRIFVNEIGLQPLLFKSLPMLLEQLSSKFVIHKWYYLIYQSPKTEIRLRILPSNPQEKSEITTLIQDALLNSGWIERILIDTYYPELEKYGHQTDKISDSESIFHRESELILGVTNSPLNKALQLLSEKERIDWGIDRFFGILEKTQYLQDFFGYFRNWVKEIPSEERKYLNRQLLGTTNLPKDDLLEELDNRMVEEKGRDDLFRILPNHLHLCCNRLFPTGPETPERTVVYGVYKKLGESTYRLTRTKNVSSNRSL